MKGRGLSIVLGVFACAASSAADRWLINGTVVEDGSYPEVVRIQTGAGGCTATVVGSKVILTAAHCGDDGATSVFQVGGRRYRAQLHLSELYKSRNLDLAMGILEEDIRDVQPVTIGGAPETGQGVTILGYGCTRVGGGKSDGLLRVGETVVTSFRDFDMVSKTPGGSALCFGDSGGPTYEETGGATVQVGVHSRANLRDTNIDIRTDLPEAQAFFRKIARDYEVEICGVNGKCPTLAADRTRR